MAKVYYKAINTISYEWVDRLEDATHEPVKESAEITQNKFPGAALVEVLAKTQQSTSTWVVSKDK
jgi:hypothetical protein